MAVTWNPSDKSSGTVLSNGNLTYTNPTADGGARGNVSHSTGKYYYEARIDAGDAFIGWAPSTKSLTAVFSDAFNAGWFGPVTAGGHTWAENAWAAFSVKSLSASEWGRLAIDLDAGKFWIGNSAGWDGDPAAGTGGYSIPSFSGLALFPFVSGQGISTSADLTANFGGSAFAYTVPSGFVAWDYAPITYTMSAGAGAFALSGTAASLKGSRKLAAGAGSFALAGSAVNLRAARKLAAGSGAFSLAGTAVNLRISRKLTASASSFALAGAAVGLKAARKLAAGSGAFSLTGGATVQGYRMTVSAASFGLSGGAVALRAGRSIAAGASSFSLAGGAANLLTARKLAAGAGAISLSGSAAMLVRGYPMLADPGSFTFAGDSVSLTATRRMTADTLAYALAGGAVKLRYSGWETPPVHGPAWTGQSQPGGIWTLQPASNPTWQ